MAEKTECLRRMFPDLDRLDLNRPLAGEAFEVLAESNGIGVAARQVNVQPQGREACTACESYRNCYDLSMAKLALATALDART